VTFLALHFILTSILLPFSINNLNSSLKELIICSFLLLNNHFKSFSFHCLGDLILFLFLVNQKSSFTFFILNSTHVSLATHFTGLFFVTLKTSAIFHSLSVVTLYLFQFFHRTSKVSFVGNLSIFQTDAHSKISSVLSACLFFFKRPRILSIFSFDIHILAHILCIFSSNTQNFILSSMEPAFTNFFHFAIHCSQNKLKAIDAHQSIVSIYHFSIL
jgi:hypothetical protein